VKRNWLWDVNVSEAKARKILKDESDPRFIYYASLLVSRNDDTRYVFKVLDKELFCRYWPLIKKKLEQKGWFSPHKSEYWQPIYEQSLYELKKAGTDIHTFPEIPISRYQFRLAKDIRGLRKGKGLTQFQMAQYLGVKQQYISKLETGRLNPSLDTIGKIANIFAKNLVIQFE